MEEVVSTAGLLLLDDDDSISMIVVEEYCSGGICREARLRVLFGCRQRRNFQDGIFR